MPDEDPLHPFYLEVYFSGLVFYVTDKPRPPDGSITRVTHVVLRDGRKGNHDYHHGLASSDASGVQSEIVKSDFEHVAMVGYVQSDGERCWEELKDEWLYFRWLDKNDKVVSRDLGAEPCGEPEDVKERLPDACTASSFYWVPFMSGLGPKNPVREDCYDEAEEKSGAVACVELRGGKLETSVFGWVHELKPKPDTTNEVEKERWIPRLRFCPDYGLPAPMDRAAAEGVTWTLTPPPNAVRLLICKAPFKDSETHEEVASFDVEPGEKALVGVTNYSRKRDMPDNQIHPGRGHDHGSLHFEMFYDLLQAPVPPGIRHIPWTPGACRERPEWLKNAIPYRRIGAYPVDVGNEKRAEKKLDYDTAAEAFAKDDRPLCVSGGGSG